MQVVASVAEIMFEDEDGRMRQISSVDSAAVAGVCSLCFFVFEFFLSFLAFFLSYFSVWLGCVFLGLYSFDFFLLLLLF